MLGQAVAAETTTPLAHAAVFLERDGDRDETPIVTLTDEQGVFELDDLAPGRYRLAVYKDARRLEVRGLWLGAPGTTAVLMRLPMR